MFGDRTLSTRKRLNLELTPEAYALLQELADASGKTMADVLRTGLALYGIAQNASRSGRHLGIVEGQTIIEEIMTV